ncbi:MAG: MraY family glycosyltransferase [Actinomycetota bacterium]
MRDHLIVLCTATVVTALVTPVVRRLATAAGAVVAPDERRVHERPTATSGGAAMLVGLFAAVGVATQLPTYEPVFAGSTEPVGVLIAATVIFLVGLLDDLREVSAPAKVTGQALAGVVLYALGVTMFFFKVPVLGVVVLGPELAPLVTVLWVVLMANAINLIDGLDGLAAGVVAIAAGAFFLYSLLLRDEGQIGPENVGPLVALATVGLCLGFLVHNVHPAKIFMGDSGALLLGLLMAASTMVVGGRANDQFAGGTYFFFAPVAIPFLVLGVALLDTVFAIARRATRRVGLSTPDKDHLHHRLLRLGHTHRQSVAILWAWTLLLSATALYPAFAGSAGAFVPIGVAAAALVGFTVLVPRLARDDGDDQPAEPTRSRHVHRT